MRLFAYELSLTIRRLLRRPGQAALLLATFWVSIGLSSLSWALFHTIFLKPPSFDPAGTLVWVNQRPQVEPSTRERATYDEYIAWREQQSSFDDFEGATLYRTIFLTSNDGVERVSGANLSSGILRMLGAQPLLGRLFGPADDVPGCEPTVLLSHGIWQARFGGDVTIIGRSVLVDSLPTTVIGVMAPTFQFPNNQQLWLPLGFHPSLSTRNNPVLDIVGRLKPGQTAATAVDDLQRISQQRSAEIEAARLGLQPRVEPFRHVYIRSQLRLSAAVLLTLSLIFVLVSCVNTANLVLIEFSGRAPELATVTALGIPRSAALRSLFLQLLVITAAAAALGILAVLWVAPLAYRALTLWDAPYWLVFSLEFHHVLLAAGLAFLATALAGFGPGLYLWWTKPEDLIREGTGSFRGSAKSGWRRTIMVVQVALLTVLAVFAGLLVRSSFRLSQLKWGFDPEPVYNLRTGMRPVDFPRQELRTATFERMLMELRRLPGVAHAALAHELPGYDNSPDCFYAAQPDGLADGRATGGAVHFIVSDEMFATLALPFVEGETFIRNATPDTPDYAIITHGLAQRLWPDQSALGRTVYMRKGYNTRAAPRALVVRGVVADHRAGGPMNSEHEAVFTSLAHDNQMFFFLLVRGHGRLPDEGSIRSVVRRIDPRLPLYFGAPFARQLEMGMQVVHLTTRLTLLFAVVATVLCAVGVYSLTVFQLLRRTRDFGIRLALGGESYTLWRQFALGNLAAVVLGVLVGLLGAAAGTPLLAALLTGITPRDPVAFAGAAILITLVSIIACVPSWRRLRRIDPAECLRTF